MEKLDSHYYDTKIEVKIPEVNKTDDEKKQVFLSFLLPKVNESKDPGKVQAMQAVHLLVNDSKNNYDPSDRIHACDLLYLVCEKIKEKPLLWIDLETVIIQQLADIMNGQCPQGRTKRILQLYLIVN